MYDISAYIYVYIYFLHFGNTLLLHCGQSVNSIKLRPEKKIDFIKNNAVRHLFKLLNGCFFCEFLLLIDAKANAGFK